MSYGSGCGIRLSMALESCCDQPDRAVQDIYQLSGVRASSASRTHHFQSGRRRTTSPAANADSTRAFATAVKPAIAWRAEWKLFEPVLFDGDSSDVKVKKPGLRKNLSTNRNSTEELLINGLDPVRIRPTRQLGTTKTAAKERCGCANSSIAGSALGLALRPVRLMTPDVAVATQAKWLHDRPDETRCPSDASRPSSLTGAGRKVDATDQLLCEQGRERRSATPSMEKSPRRRGSEETGDRTSTGVRSETARLLQLAEGQRRIINIGQLISSRCFILRNRLSVPVRHPDEIIQQVKPIEMIRSDGVRTRQIRRSGRGSCPTA